MKEWGFPHERMRRFLMRNRVTRDGGATRPSTPVHPTSGPRALRGPASPELVASATTPIAATVPVSPVDRGETSRVALTTQVYSPKSAGPQCLCGCGDTTKGGKYKPGHDAKHRSKLQNKGKVPPQIHYGKSRAKHSGLYLVRDNTKVA